MQHPSRPLPPAAFFRPRLTLIEASDPDRGQRPLVRLQEVAAALSLDAQMEVLRVAQLLWSLDA